MPLLGNALSGCNSVVYDKKYKARFSAPRFGYYNVPSYASPLSDRFCSESLQNHQSQYARIIEISDTYSQLCDSHSRLTYPILP